MKYIDTDSALREIFGLVRASAWVAVDTEADSLHHYAEKLSLLQLTVGEEDFVIDPLANIAIQELLDLVGAKLVYFHAADSDIRLLKKAYRFSPVKIFDTMIAAQILGYPKIGLADLAEKHCSIKLSKAEQKADWSARPLDEKLIRYAANDTHYLPMIIEAMRQELREAGRSEWHSQMCDRLLETLEALKVQDDDRSSAWQIKGSRHLRGKPLTYLKALWTWRDDLARQKDKPSFKVLNSDYLIQLAQWAAENPGKDVAEWKEAPRNVRNEHRNVLNELLKRAADEPQALLDAPDRKFARRKWGERETKTFGDLKGIREKVGLELKIHPSLIATNAILETIAFERPKNLEELKKSGNLLPWQMDVAGEEFLKAIS